MQWKRKKKQSRYIRVINRNTVKHTDQGANKGGLENYGDYQNPYPYPKGEKRDTTVNKSWPLAGSDK